ncbi:ABC transporter permease [Corynebacterium urinipleomorphum]|uniref:ABC transporter permease n=1 Tax=Corynebacterium urinipleomorphum TaxID=1852380 RepID=UPI000B34AB56|nr:ABC transporter permease [Corynebacterium urinipleomorphum]
MELLRNDLLKFRRSHLWTVITLVPLIAVVIGAGNYAGNREQLSEGWDSYLSQIMLFYGMLFMAAGIAIIASAAWRVEHRGHNWLCLLTSTQSAGSLIAAKIGAITLATATMHTALVIFAVVGGKSLGLPGAPPRDLLLVAALALLPATAVAAWQSLLSMVIRNFAGPVAIALIGSIISFGVLAAGAPVIRFTLPPALLTDTLWLGSTSVADAHALTFGTAAQVLFISAAFTFVGWLAAVTYLRKTDVRL